MSDKFYVVIDPGHGGKDGGAIGNGLLEKNLTLDISKYMYEKFKELGIPVYLTRDKDEDLPKDERIKRITSAFGKGSDVIVISNHINAGGGEGAEVIYALRNKPDLSERILNNIAAAGQKIRKIYQKRLPSNNSKDYYYIIRETPNNETIIVEYGFIDNTKDASRIKNNYKKYVEGVINAILEYKGIDKTLESSYTVKAGDTLWNIAKKFGLTVDEIKKNNNLTSNLLTIGQVLALTNNKINDFEYIVELGDTLYSIAKKNNITVDKLKVLNNLSDNILKVGQVLKISKDEIMDNDFEKYIVQRGDTLYYISRLYNVSIDELKKLNNLNDNNLNIGMEILIPKGDKNKIYTVQKGDTLFKIASINNTTVEKLMDLNNLSTEFLSIGQKLLV